MHEYVLTPCVIVGEVMVAFVIWKLSCHDCAAVPVFSEVGFAYVVPTVAELVAAHDVGYWRKNVNVEGMPA